LYHFQHLDSPVTSGDYTAHGSLTVRVLFHRSHTCSHALLSY